MRSLKLQNSPLLKNVPEFFNNSQNWSDNEALQIGRNVIAKAITGGDVKAEVFSTSDAPKYALLALDSGQIDLAQFTSFMLRWAAFKDFKDRDISDIQFHQLSTKDQSSKQIFKRFLKVEEIDQVKSNVSFDPKLRERIISSMLENNIDESERRFITFKAKSNLPILEGLHAIGFTFFMPRKLADGWEVLVPSFTMMKTALAVSSPDNIELVPVIGEDSLENVHAFHSQNQHPFGISFPGHEHKEGDGFEAGCFGFALHDFYHITLLSFIPFRKLINECADKGFDFLKAEASDNKLVKWVLDSLVDGELRAFISNTNFGGGLFESANKDSIFLALAYVVMIGFAKNYPKSFTSSKLTDPKSISLEKFASKTDLALLRQIMAIWFSHVLNSADENKTVGFSFSKSACILDKRTAQAKLLLEELPKQRIGAFHDQGKIALRVFILSLQQYQSVYEAFLEGTSQESTLFRSYLKQHGLVWIEKKQGYLKQLFDFSKEGKADELKALIGQLDFSEYVSSLDVQDSIGITPLSWAVKNGREDAVGVLISARADVNFIVGESGESQEEYDYKKITLGKRLLHLAAESKKPKLITRLLMAGANPYVYDSDKTSGSPYKYAPVDVSIVLGDVESIRAFLPWVSISRAHIQYLRSQDKIHSDSERLLNQYFSFKESLQQAKYKLDSVVLLSTENFPLNAITESGFDEDEACYEVCPKYSSSLFSACRSGNVLKFLIQQTGQSINAVDEEGYTYLMREIECCGKKLKPSLEKIAMLIAAGIDVNRANNKGKTALDLAIKGGFIELIKLLLESGAKFDKTTLGSKLNQAIQEDLLTFFNQSSMSLSLPNEWNFDSVEILKLFLEHGFDLNVLMMAQEVSESFIAFTAPKFTIQTMWSFLRGQPLYVSTGWGRRSKAGSIDAPLELRTFFVENGANVNQPDFNGVPELFIAIKNGWIDYANLLISKGADVNAIGPNELEHSALHHAVILNKPEFVSLLLKSGANEVPDASNKLPRNYAKESNHQECLKALLQPPVVTKVTLFEVRHPKLFEDEDALKFSIK